MLIGPVVLSASMPALVVVASPTWLVIGAPEVPMVTEPPVDEPRMASTAPVTSGPVEATETLPAPLLTAAMPSDPAPRPITEVVEATVTELELLVVARMPPPAPAVAVPVTLPPDPAVTETLPPPIERAEMPQPA